MPDRKKAKADKENKDEDFIFWRHYGKGGERGFGGGFAKTEKKI